MLMDFKYGSSSIHGDAKLDNVRQCSKLKEIHPFKRTRHETTVRQNRLLWGHRVIPRQKLRSQMLETFHQGHLGIVKMKALARNYFWLPGLDKDIDAMSKSCSGCAMSQPDLSTHGNGQKNRDSE
ncbi:retrotransposable element Tf2 protein type 1 [Elysia marginata]|uniref:Retrotransposable element Tf2 protein type 1 n=1 Tax=Elysia marginata TaxID=1093978 RepID=A0AAV4J4C2_9GAST|nr:retrotransposable element Tf2 protein type 1 [Elysia marginata]